MATIALSRQRDVVACGYTGPRRLRVVFLPRTRRHFSPSHTPSLPLTLSLRIASLVRHVATMLTHRGILVRQVAILPDLDEAPERVRRRLALEFELLLGDAVLLRPLLRGRERSLGTAAPDADAGRLQVVRGVGEGGRKSVGSVLVGGIVERFDGGGRGGRSVAAGVGSSALLELEHFFAKRDRHELLDGAPAKRTGEVLADPLEDARAVERVVAREENYDSDRSTKRLIEHKESYNSNSSK